MENTQLPQDIEIKSIWKSFSSGTVFPVLEGSTTADVAIIGAGITGITAAQLLKEAGLNVVVLESLKVGGGSTGGSTGNLYVTVEEGFDMLKSKYDEETIKTIASARGEAVNLVERNVLRYSIDCDFKRVPWYLYSSNKENKKRIDKEYKAIQDAGTSVVEIDPGEIPFPVENGIRVDNQAQFNPLRYVQQLALAIADESCRIFEDTAVQDIEEDDIITVKTNRGEVQAKYVIHATHTPKGLFLDFHSLLGTYREYGVAVKLASGNYPQGIFWGYYNSNDRYSVRSYEHEGQKFLMAIGQPHEVGQKEDNHENILNVEKFLRERFDVAEVTNRWAGQNYKPADGIPYIGRKSKGSDVFVATGFSTDGLTYGTLSAMIIKDLITGNETAYTKLFDATRHNPLKAAGKFIKENAINAAEIIKDYIFFKDAKLDEIATGEGKVIEVDGKKLAVYNDATGSIKACSAICTHMGCIVHFNKAEKTWDCPCHASRFDTDGGIIEGPALTPLRKVDIKQ
jgi:glycine/D-amino acid oxidase-like deaminating enzyme/nitrite reductase/ring-hydroxylating ferredoxin subunit